MAFNKRIIKNIAASLLGEGVGGLLNIYIIVLIARTLGPEKFGDFAFVLAFVGLIQLVTDLGITNLLVREISQKLDQYTTLLGNVRLLSWSVSSVVIVPVAIVCLLWLDDTSLGLSLFLMTLAALATFHSVIYGALFRAFEKMEFNAAIFVVHKFILLGFVLYWIEHNPTIPSLCFCFLLANTYQFLLFYLCTIFTFKPIRWQFDLAMWKYLVLESIPIGFSMLFRKATLHVDTLLLKAISTPLALGLFNAAYRIIQIVEMIPFTLSIPMYPKLSQLALERDHRFTDFLNQILQLYMILAIPMVSYVCLHSTSIISIMFTPEFAESAPVLQALSAAIFFIFPSSLMIYVFSALGHQRYFTGISAAVLACKLVLDLILIPTMHAFGAAIGTVAAEATFMILSLVFLYRLSIKVDFWKMLFKPALAAIVANLVVLQFFTTEGLLRFVLASLVFGIIYLAMIAVMFRGFRFPVAAKLKQEAANETT